MYETTGCVECFRDRDTSEYYLGSHKRGYNQFTTALCEDCAQKFVKAEWALIGKKTQGGEVAEIHALGGS